MPIETSGGIPDAYKVARTMLAVPRESEVRITIPVGTPEGAQFVCQVYPEDKKALVITYFELTTPLGVEGNIVLETEYGKATLIEPNQPENRTEFYDPSDYGLRFFYVTSFYLVAETKRQLPTDATVYLKFSGGRRVV